MSKSLILTCPTLRRELLNALAKANSDTTVYFLPAALHNSPPKLHEYLQSFIDSLANVERVLICVSGCGGGTRDLRATTAELVIPKTADCLDILLSGGGFARPARGIFLTESWMQFMQNSEIDLAKMQAKLGEEQAAATLRKLYSGFTDFYIIDTGAYDTKPVREYITPLVELLGGQIHTVPGRYELLRKLAAGQIDKDFIIVPKGESSAKYWQQVQIQPAK
jgi:hypothetical protein